MEWEEAPSSPRWLPEGQYPQHSHLPSRDMLIKTGVKDVLELCIADVESLCYKQELVRKFLHTGSPLPKRKEPPVLSCHLMSRGAGRWEQEDAHCSAESSFGWLVRSVRYGEWMRARTQIQEGKGIFINNNINNTNKNYPIWEKQTGWTRQGKARQGKARQDRTQGIHSIKQRTNKGLQT